MPPTASSTSRGRYVEKHGWVPGVPSPAFRGWGLGETRFEAHTCMFQVRSRDTSVEEWKGSETYSPNTAYGKTPALTPASK